MFDVCGAQRAHAFPEWETFFNFLMRHSSWNSTALVMRVLCLSLIQQDFLQFCGNWKVNWKLQQLYTAVARIQQQFARCIEPIREGEQSEMSSDAEQM